MNSTKFPQAFLDRMKNYLGADFEAFIKSQLEQPPPSLRLNPFKTISDFNGEEIIPWCQHGRYLKERPSFTFDPLFHAGAYYVQEASSMFLEDLFRQINKANRDLRVLDLCAAPGGKSTHLLSLISTESLLVSNEIIPTRNKVLQQNVLKWGTANCIVTQNKSEDFNKAVDFFDVILVDAPCSGEGLFRKDPDAMDEWSEKNINICAIRQKEILANLIQALKPGGHLIYSTCTYESQENDEVVKWFADSFNFQTFQIDSTPYPSIKRTSQGIQFLPHRTKGEGFYLAVLKKEGLANFSLKSTASPVVTNQFLFQYLNVPSNFIEFRNEERIHAIPTSISADFNYLRNNFYIKHAGIFAGQMKGSDFLPAHDLALSIHLKAGLPSIDLDYNNAIRYLQGEAIGNQTAEKGWQLVRYKGFNLGWVKALQSRLNNYYPKDLRILKRNDSKAEIPNSFNH